MKKTQYEIDKIRSIGIIAHINAGKTTTTERILNITGKNRYMGSVDEGTTCTDYLSAERERGITIVSSAVTCPWKSHKLHIIDTPGHVDFTAEVERSLRVLDGAIMLICGVSGVQTQTETVWRQADKHHIPRIIYINKLDRVGANYQMVIEDVQQRFDCHCVIMNVPYYQNEKLVGIIDIFERKLISIKNNTQVESPIPPEVSQQMQSILEQNLDLLTMLDDSLMEAVLSGDYTTEMIDEIIKYGTNMQKIIPIYCGSSGQNVGVSQLLDGVVKYLPSPKEAQTDVHFQDENVAYIFKVQYIDGYGKVAFARIYNGSFSTGTKVYNLRTGAMEEILSIQNVYADMFEDIHTAIAGEIVALGGLNDIKTGDTLSSDKMVRPLESITFAHPVMQVRIEPVNDGDFTDLYNGVQSLAEQDTSIEIRNDNDTGAILLCGMGELHIDVFLQTLKQKYKLPLRSGAPNITHTVMLTSNQSVDFTFDYRTASGSQQIKITASGMPHSTDDIGECNVTVNNNEKYDNQQLQAIIRGVNNALNVGMHNCSVVGCNFEIKSVEWTESPMELVLETAMNLCITKMLNQSHLETLEPIMNVTIESPTESTGLVLGDLKSKNAQILDISYKMTNDEITAFVPLQQLIGYSTKLRNQTQGRGNFSMEFSHYAIVK